MNNAIEEQSPCFLLFPFLIHFCPPFVSLYLLGTLLAVIGSCPPRSQVARKLISPFPSPSPYTPHSKIPTPWGFPELNMRLTKTTSRTWLTRSRTPCLWKSEIQPSSGISPHHDDEKLFYPPWHQPTLTAADHMLTWSADWPRLESIRLITIEICPPPPSTVVYPQHQMCRIYSVVNVSLAICIFLLPEMRYF